MILVKEGEYWMSKLGVVKIAKIYQNDFDGWVFNTEETVIYNMDGTVYIHPEQDMTEYNLLYKITKDNHPEYFL